MGRGKQFTEFQLSHCDMDGLVRLCRWLKIDESSDLKRGSLIGWLQWN